MRRSPSRIASLALGLAIASAAFTSASAQTQSFPQRPITMMVGFPPGTAPDTLARLVADPLAKALGQPVIIDNRPGAGGQIAAAALARGTRDGYQIMLGDLGAVGIAPFAFKPLSYDSARDFVPISEVARTEFVWVVPSQRPHRTLSDFLAASKGSSNRVLVATFGVGSPAHLGAEILALQGGFTVEPVHFRTPAEGLAAFASGQVEGSFFSVPFAGAQLPAGRIRALFQTGPSRSRVLPPDIPTAAEVGLPDLRIAAWMMLLAPSGTPAEVVDRLGRAIAEVLKDQALARKIEDMGFNVVGSLPADAASRLRSELTRWAQVVERSGVKITN
jgi:tripartite-type tricarboxylate transporter receptor subunit TctC